MEIWLVPDTNSTALWRVCSLQIHQDLREDLAKVKTLDGLADVSKQLKQRCQVANAVLNLQENVQVNDVSSKHPGTGQGGESNQKAPLCLSF